MGQVISVTRSCSRPYSLAVENEAGRESTDRADDAATEFEHNVMRNIFELFVVPEVQRRGLSIDPYGVDRFLVELPADGGQEVWLGDEAPLKIFIKDEDSVQYLDGIEPGEGAVHPDSGWACYFQVEGARILRFDFRRNREKAQGLLTKAESFLRLGKSAGKDSLDAAIDLLHSAAELSVQAMMLLQSDVDPNHGRRREWLRRWAELENSPSSHAQVLDNLAALRKPARYGPDTPPLKPGRLERIVATVQEMIDTAGEYVGDRRSSMKVQIAAEFAEGESPDGPRPTQSEQGNRAPIHRFADD